MTLAKVGDPFSTRFRFRRNGDALTTGTVAVRVYTTDQDTDDQEYLQSDESTPAKTTTLDVPFNFLAGRLIDRFDGTDFATGFSFR